jgi:hypothetical protein
VHLNPVTRSELGLCGLFSPATAAVLRTSCDRHGGSEQWPAASGAADAEGSADTAASLEEAASAARDSTTEALETALKTVKRADAVVVLQTRSVLLQPWLLCELFEACRGGVPLVTVHLRGGGYDHEHAKRCLAQLPTELEAQRPGALAALRELLEPRALTVDELQRCVSSVLLRIISVEISLEGTENHVRAAVSDVVEKVQRAKAAKANESRV